MAPSDFPPGQAVGYIFPIALRVTNPTGGISQVPVHPIAARRPLGPRGANRLHATIPTAIILASPLFTGWPLPTELTGLISVRLRYGSQLRRTRLRRHRCRCPRSIGYMCNRQFTWLPPFRKQGCTSLPGAQRATRWTSQVLLPQGCLK
jgi:hypothetical protein